MDSDNYKMYDLFERYLENRCNRGEVQRLLNYFEEAENEAELRKLIIKSMSAQVTSGLSQDPKHKETLDKAYSEIQKTINPVTPEFHHKNNIWPRIVAAAAILLVVGFSWLLMDQPVATEMHETITEYGEYREVILSDGSVVHLNAGSSFSYPEPLVSKDGQRNVSLDSGEAYFEVNSNPDIPFVVQAGNTTVQVLGTSFNMKAYRDDETSRVTVSSGEVEVRFGASQAILLQTNQQAVWDKAAQRIIRSELSVSDIGSWRQNKMVFNNELLSEVFRSLERHYEIEIVVERPVLLDEHVTFKFDNQPLEAVLEALSFAKQFEFEWTSNNVITIK